MTDIETYASRGVFALDPPGIDDTSTWQLESRQVPVAVVAGRDPNTRDRVRAMVALHIPGADMLDQADAAASAVVTRVRAEVETAVTSSPEAEAVVAADERLKVALAEFEAADAKALAARGEYDAALARGDDPRPFRVAAESAAADATDCRKWVDTLREAGRAADAQFARVRAARVREGLLAARRPLAGRREQLRRRIEDVLTPLIGELLSIHAIERALKD